MEYPRKLWKSHNDYPLAPEKTIVNGVEKLIGSFKPRKNYVVHYQNLKQYLEEGMRLTAVYRRISFSNLHGWRLTSQKIQSSERRKQTVLRKTF